MANAIQQLSGLGAALDTKVRMVWSEYQTGKKIRSGKLLDKSKSVEHILWQAINDFYTGNLSDTEKQHIAAIEKLRDSLLHSDESIQKEEYGAGSRAMNGNAATEKVSDVCRIASKKQQPCLLLYHIIKSLNPDIALELGTCLGISAAYQALAMKDNGQGKLFTIEGSRGRAEVAEMNLVILDLPDFAEVIAGRFEVVLEKELQRLKCLDYAFIDGHHQEQPTVNYFKQILPYFKNGGIMVFDDIFWSSGMMRAWKTIKNSGSFDVCLEIKGFGIGVINRR
jgi:predicted O-methyltransferase YrrM